MKKILNAETSYTPPPQIIAEIEKRLKRKKALLPETGYLRLSQIIGDNNKGIPPIIPVSKSTWWAGVKSGRFPKPDKLGPRTTVWRVEIIRAFIENPDGWKNE